MKFRRSFNVEIMQAVLAWCAFLRYAGSRNNKEATPMPEERKTKVFWSSEEKALICAEAGRLLFSLTATGRLAALHQAQEKLPPGRRRKLATLTGLSWFTDGVQRELEQLRAEVHQERTAAVEHPDPETLGLESLYPLVRKRLVSELAAFLSDVLQEVRWPTALGEPDVAAAAGSALLRSVLSVVPPTVKLRHVLVVGLRGGQMEEVRREHGKKLDLRFCGADENKDKLRFMCEQADVSIAMTDFISHSHEDILLKRAKKYVRSAGGLTRLKELLHGVENQTELAAAA